MKTQKDVLVERAEELGLETSGSTQVLKARVEAVEKKMTMGNKAFEEDLPVVEAPKTQILEELPKKPIPEALPAAEAADMVTATAKKTCEKFIGKWYRLSAGKTVTAPSAVIRALKQGGFVE